MYCWSKACWSHQWDTRSRMPSTGMQSARKYSIYSLSPRKSNRAFAYSKGSCGPTATPPATMLKSKLSNSVRSSYLRFRSLSGTENTASISESSDVEREGAKIPWSFLRKLSTISEESW